MQYNGCSWHGGRLRVEHARPSKLAQYAAERAGSPKRTAALQAEHICSQPTVQPAAPAILSVVHPGSDKVLDLGLGDEAASPEAPAEAISAHVGSSMLAAVRLTLCPLAQLTKPVLAKRKTLFPPAQPIAKRHLSWDMEQPAANSRKLAGQLTAWQGAVRELGTASGASSLESGSSVSKRDSSTDEGSDSDRTSSDWELQAAHSFRSMQQAFQRPSCSRLL